MGDVYATDREAQCAVQEIALTVLSLTERLEEIAAGLYQPPEMDAMLNGQVPVSVAVDLQGSIECTVTDGPTAGRQEAQAGCQRHGGELAAGVCRAGRPVSKRPRALPALRDGFRESFLVRFTRRRDASALRRLALRSPP
jgi:hypothetical protein